MRRALLLWCWWMFAGPALAQPSQPTSAPASQPASAPAVVGPASAPVLPAALLPYVPILDASLSPATARPGDVVVYTLSIERPAEASVLVPAPPFPKELRPLGARVLTQENSEDGMLREVRTWSLYAQGLGELTVPGVEVVFRAPSGEEGRAVAPLARGSVPPTLPPGAPLDEAFTPRTPGAPAAQRAAWGPWALTAGLAALALLALAIWRRRVRPAPPRPAPSSPLDRALSALQALEQEPPPAYDLYLALSSVLRVYLEDALSLPARGATSQELLDLLAARALPGLDRAALQAWLAEADLVKYAKADRARPARMLAVQQLRAFLLATRPGGAP